MESFINWKSYFLPEQKNEYNLTETKNIKLFNTNDLNMEGTYQINYLNKYLGELVMMYYIWKNNIKSEYICISQYRKDMAYINFDRLKNNEIQVYLYWNNFNKYNPIETAFDKEIDPDGVLKQKFIEYLDIQTIYNKETLKFLKTESKNQFRMACLVFAMKWEVFCELCEFTFGFLDYILQNNKWQDFNELLKLRDDQYNRFLKYNEIPKGWSLYVNETRYIVWLIEHIYSTCLTSLYSVFQENIYIPYNILLRSNDLNEIIYFYRKNKKINTEKMYFLVDDDHYEELHNKFEIDMMKYCFPNAEIIKSENNINMNNLIILNGNEYIDIDDLYSINNMSINEIQKYIKQL